MLAPSHASRFFLIAMIVVLHPVYLQRRLWMPGEVLTDPDENRLVAKGLARYADPPRQQPELPLVTAICPTRGRPDMLPGAVECFLAQTYPRKELLIVADAEEDLPRNLRPDQENIRVLFWNEKRNGNGTVGSKRNFCCEHSRGEIIVHWDDDDWSHPDRIQSQVAMISGEIMVTGYHTIIFHGKETGTWKYIGSKHYALGTSLAYRKEWWRRKPFPDLHIGEDNAFVIASRGRLRSVDGSAMMVARIHDRSTSPKVIRGRQWVRTDDLPRGFPGRR